MPGVSVLRLGASADRAPAHPLGVAGRAPAVPLRPLRARGHLARVARAGSRVLTGWVQPVLAGGIAELAARVLRDGPCPGAPSRARPERHSPEPVDLVRRAAARPLHRALPRLHAGVQVLHRQLALQVPDDLIIWERETSVTLAVADTDCIQCATFWEQE